MLGVGDDEVLLCSITRVHEYVIRLQVMHCITCSVMQASRQIGTSVQEVTQVS